MCTCSNGTGRKVNTVCVPVIPTVRGKKKTKGEIPKRKNENGNNSNNVGGKRDLED